MPRRFVGREIAPDKLATVKQEQAEWMARVAAANADVRRATEEAIQSISLSELRKRAAMQLFCPCGRVLAFAVQIDGRFALWTAGGEHRPEGAYSWLDSDWWGASATCARCARSLTLELDMWCDLASTSVHGSDSRVHLGVLDMDGHERTGSV